MTILFEPVIMQTENSRKIDLLCQLALISEYEDGTLAPKIWDSFLDLIDWVGPEKRYNLYIVPEIGPDICYNCRSYFGETVSGRIREGCSICQGKWADIKWSTTDRFFHLLKTKFGHSQVEFSMAQMLFLRSNRNV